jgi:glycosyltransferase involved in cell wall biosynthesis
MTTPIPDYTVIVPAYNEEVQLPRSLSALRSAMDATSGLRGEVVVVDNNSTDRTAAVALEHGARVVFEPVNQISRARNCGAAAAAGRYLVFVDADTVVGGELLAAALAALGSGHVCGGGTVVGSSEEAGPAVRNTIGFWNWLSRHRRWAAGCFVYCLRQAWSDVGGFSQEVYASEEILFSRALVKWGRSRGLHFRILDIPVDTSLRKVRWYSPWQLLGFVLAFTVCPWRLRSRHGCRLWYERPSATTTPSPQP